MFKTTGEKFEFEAGGPLSLWVSACYEEITEGLIYRKYVWLIHVTISSHDIKYNREGGGGE